MYNLIKLQKAIDRMDLRARFISMDYYFPKYLKLIQFCADKHLQVRF